MTDKSQRHSSQPVPTGARSVLFVNGFNTGFVFMSRKPNWFWRLSQWCLLGWLWKEENGE